MKPSSARAPRHAAALVALVLLVGLVVGSSLSGCTESRRFAGLRGGSPAVDAGWLCAVGGTVRGLGAATLTLSENSTGSVMVPQDGPFTFGPRLANDATYIVTAQPT